MDEQASSVPDVVNEVPASSSDELIKIDLIKALILELTGKILKSKKAWKTMRMTVVSIMFAVF